MGILELRLDSMIYLSEMDIRVNLLIVKFLILHPFP